MTRVIASGARGVAIQRPTRDASWYEAEGAKSIGRGKSPLERNESEEAAVRAIQGNDWSEDTIARLRHLWNEGRSTADIGRHLGISKNAIIGKAHRLDLPRRKSPIKRSVPTGAAPVPKRPTVPVLADIMPIATCAQPSDAPRAAPGRDPVAATPATAGPRMSFLGASEPCCWPLGDPGTSGFRYCDAPALVGRPYCDEHARSARRPSCERNHQVRRVPRTRDLNVPG